LEASVFCGENLYFALISRFKVQQFLVFGFGSSSMEMPGRTWYQAKTRHPRRTTAVKGDQSFWFFTVTFMV